MAADPSVRTGPEIGELAFARGGRLLVSAFMYAERHVVAIGFLILDGDDLDNKLALPGLNNKQMLAICFVACTVNYGAMAVLGYLMYGDGVQSTGDAESPAARLS
nr:unnamed protein product [Digitaria exilis]